ncbi:MAG: JAB domain-containing protein [Alphaproteobacteria bacterium]|nr:JAB domain-containing protein [Alphaproteobacteria bacterium]
MFELTAEDANENKDDNGGKDSKKKSPHFHGHRQRLREKILKQGGELLPDYELLEFILMLAIPRKDVKPLAKDLIDHFGGYAAVISAESDELIKVDGVKENTIAALKAVQASAIRMLKDEVADKPMIDNHDALIDYCRASMSFGKTERFRVLYFDVKNKLIADELQSKGTINHTPLYPREIVKRALDLHAYAFIMVHNHPSGDPTPSKLDVKTTKEVNKAAEVLGVKLYDHIVITKTEYVSFRETGLI